MAEEASFAIVLDGLTALAGASAPKETAAFGGGVTPTSGDEGDKPTVGRIFAARRGVAERELRGENMSDYGLNFGFLRSDESSRSGAEGRFKTPVGSALLLGTMVEIDPATPGYLKQSAINAAVVTGYAGLLLQELEWDRSIYESEADVIDSFMKGVAKPNKLAVITSGAGTKVWFKNTAGVTRADGREIASRTMATAHQRRRRRRPRLGRHEVDRDQRRNRDQPSDEGHRDRLQQGPRRGRPAGLRGGASMSKHTLVKSFASHRGRTSFAGPRPRRPRSTRSWPRP
jgi:hypothetical protein